MSQTLPNISHCVPVPLSTHSLEQDGTGTTSGSGAAAGPSPGRRRLPPPAAPLRPPQDGRISRDRGGGAQHAPPPRPVPLVTAQFPFPPKRPPPIRGRRGERALGRTATPPLGAVLPPKPRSPRGAPAPRTRPAQAHWRRAPPESPWGAAGAGPRAPPAPPVPGPGRDGGDASGREAQDLPEIREVSLRRPGRVRAPPRSFPPPPPPKPRSRTPEPIFPCPDLSGRP